MASKSRGTKTTQSKKSSTTGRKKTSSTQSAKTASTFSKSVENLSSGIPQGSTKNSTKKTTTTTVDSKSSPKKRVRATAPKVTASSNLEYFPHLPRFPYAFFPCEAWSDRLNKAWFDGEDRIKNHIKKYKLKQHEYTAYKYKGGL